MTFIQYNHNPSKQKVGDCAIRAISFATDRDWGTIAKQLYEYGFANNWPQTDIKTVELFLKKFENIDVKYVDIDGSKKRFKVKDIAILKGTYIIRIAGHITVVRENKIYDTWDCSEKSAYKIWRVE